VPLGTAVGPGLRAGWADLTATALEPNPFFGPDAVLAASRHLGGEGVSLLCVHDDADRLRVALPVCPARRYAHLPVPVLRAWQHDYSFLGTPLVSAHDPVGALGELVDFLIGERPAPWLALDLLAADGPVVAALLQALRLRGRWPTPFAPTRRAWLARRPQPTYLADTVRGTHLKELRRLRRVLSRQLGEEIATTDVAADPAGVEEFLALEAAGWKGRAATAFARRPGHDAFFRSVCTAARGQGSLQLLRLGGDGPAAAMKCNLRAGPGVFCFKIAYDEELARCSPGVLLELDNIDWFHRGDAEWMDSCADPNNEMINRLWPDRLELTTLLVPLAGARGTAAARTLPTFTRVSRRLRDRWRSVADGLTGSARR